MASLEDRTLRGGEAQGQDKEQESWPNHLASSAALDRVWKLRGLWVGGAPVTAWLVPRIRVASLQLHFGTGQGVGPVGPLRPGLEAAEGCWSSRPRLVSGWEKPSGVRVDISPSECPKTSYCRDKTATTQSRP